MPEEANWQRAGDAHRPPTSEPASSPNVTTLDGADRSAYHRERAGSTRVRS